VAVSVQKLSAAKVQLRCGCADVELHRLLCPDIEPARSMRLSLSASAAPDVATVTVPVFMQAGAADIEVSVGAVLEITSAVELVDLTDAVQVAAILVSSQTMLSLCRKLPAASVFEVCPGNNALFLYHFQARAPAFSMSPSGSDQAPALQVRVDVAYAGTGEMEGAVGVGIWSGYACETLVFCPDAPALSVTVTVTVVEPGVVETQL